MTKLDFPREVDFWQREAARYSQAAEQAGNRVFTIMSFALATIAAIAVGGQVTHNALLLTFAPLAGLLALALVSQQALQRSYALTWQRRAEAHMSTLLESAGTDWLSRDTGSMTVDDPRWRFTRAIWVLGTIITVCALFEIDVSAAIQNYDNWSNHATNVGGVVMWICIGLFVASTILVVFQTSRAWGSFRKFQTETAPTTDSGADPRPAQRPE